MSIGTIINLKLENKNKSGKRKPLLSKKDRRG